MAAQAVHTAHSRRFIRAYLLTWGMLAAGGLTYLGSLAFSPALSPQVAQPDPGIQAANKALAEIGTVRRVVTELQKDVGSIKTTIGQREAEEKAAQARLAALEERVTTMAAPAVQAAKAGEPEKPKVVERQEPPVAPRIITMTTTPKVVRPDVPDIPRAELPKEPRIETGSLATPVVTFGEPEVTPSRNSFAVQLAAGPSLAALQLSWSLLLDRHGGALGSLQPRFLPPRSAGGQYRLLAGPFASKAEADKVCNAMGASRQSCFSTPFSGKPL
jgi:Tfp pilus assembly protein FimV